MWSTLLAFALLAPKLAQGLLRFPCAQLTVERADPLIDPGNVSKHLHQVIGGNSFDFSMPNTTVDLSKSTCSTCSILENKSNYWSPVLYFQSPTNGSFIRVPQQPGPITGSPNAGLVVYYIQTGSGIKAFPKNFRMISGNPYLRSYDTTIDASRSIRFRCLSDLSSGTGPDTPGMPTTACAGGIRTQINFPTCWDGVNVDTPNHHDHVSYATGASFGDFGTGCPSTHPVQLPLLYLETYWDTTRFNNEPGAFSNGKQPFVWSMGDPTGYGYHADYMMGWDSAELLQQVMDQCTDGGGQVSSCSILHSRAEQDMNDCAQPPRVDEQFDGWLDALPGCNPVQPGPATATQASGCGAPTSTEAASEVSFLKTDIDGWQAVGCAAAPNGQTVLSGSSTTDNTLTVEKCLNTCAQKGFQFAGIYSTNVCQCGNSFDTSKVSSSYACNRQCAGNVSEFCGAPNRIAVYNGGAPVSVPTSTTAPTTTSSTTSPTGGSGATVPKYGQCGGQGWTGGTTCASGSKCTYSNAYYSQCL